MEYRFKFTFTKTDEMVYISHLDLLRLFSRASRRAGLPVAASAGFSPRYRITLKRALKLGVASPSEEGEIVLTQHMEEESMKEKLQAQLPGGIRIKEVVYREDIVK